MRSASSACGLGGLEASAKLLKIAPKIKQQS
jgi:hypothetical protein